jgi:hypothetical protein
VYEDLTWDKSDTMSGAGDDWAYEHLGVYAWTTEFWDAIYAATGKHSPTNIWYVGPTPEQELAVCHWSDTHAPDSYVAWRPFDHPQLGNIEIGGADTFRIWTNAPASHLHTTVKQHARFAVYQALAAPQIEIKRLHAEPVGEGVWRVIASIANTGWLGTEISALARKHRVVLPLIAEIRGATVLDGPARVQLGQLDGRVKFRINGDAKSDGTPDRVQHSWLVQGEAGTQIAVRAVHQRAGSTEASITLP